MAEGLTNDELLDIGRRMAEELQGLVDDAQEAGSDLPSVRVLLEEWEAVWRRTPFHWLNAMADETTEDLVLDEREGEDV